MKTTNRLGCLLCVLILVSGCNQSNKSLPSSPPAEFELMELPIVQSRKQEVFEWVEKEQLKLSYDDLVVSNKEITFSILGNPEIEYQIRLDELGTMSNIRYHNYSYTLSFDQQVYEVMVDYLDAKNNVASGTLTGNTLNKPYNFFYGQAIQDSTNEIDEEELQGDNPIITGEVVQEPLNTQLELRLNESIEEKKKELSALIQSQASLIQNLERILETRRNEISNFSYRSADLEATFQTSGWVRREDGLYQTKTEDGLKLFDLTLQKMLWNDSKSSEYNWFEWKGRTGVIQGCSFNLFQKSWDSTCSQETLNKIQDIQKEIAFQFDATLQQQQSSDLNRLINECLQEVTMTLSQKIQSH